MRFATVIFPVDNAPKPECTICIISNKHESVPYLVSLDISVTRLSWKWFASGPVLWTWAFTSSASFLLIAQIIVDQPVYISFSCIYYSVVYACFFVMLKLRFFWEKDFYNWLLNLVPSAMISYVWLNIWPCSIMKKLVLCWSLCSLLFFTCFGIASFSWYLT